MPAASGCSSAALAQPVTCQQAEADVVAAALSSIIRLAPCQGRLFGHGREVPL